MGTNLFGHFGSDLFIALADKFLNKLKVNDDFLVLFGQLEPIALVEIVVKESGYAF